MRGRKSRAKQLHTHTADTAKSTHTGRPNTEICRLCHGRFSVRKLRLAFGTHSDPVTWSSSPTHSESEHSTLRFSSDFQQLLGVCVQLDSTLSPYICSDCHAQFYQCHSILQSFRHRVNSTHTLDTCTESARCSSTRINNTEKPDQSSPPILFDPRCLLHLVSWTHDHAGSCSFPPNLQEVLEEQCGGAISVVWRCGDGHSYTMDTSIRERHGTCPHNHQPITSATHTHMKRTQNFSHTHTQPDGDQLRDEISSPTQCLQDSDLSDRNFSSEEETRKSSSEDNTHPTVNQQSKNICKDMKNLQPKERKKPGPKPGWKKKIRSEREELPTIYKCPHQGCTAVYRGVDGMKKHVKEHHEEVRERPCPHPGCNKVFMIDRYPQSSCRDSVIEKSFRSKVRALQSRECSCHHRVELHTLQCQLC